MDLFVHSNWTVFLNLISEQTVDGSIHEEERSGHSGGEMAKHSGREQTSSKMILSTFSMDQYGSISIVVL